jgi:hypothetical protein
VYYCVLLCITVYNILLCITVYYCVLLCIRTNAILYPLTHHSITLDSVMYFSLPTPTDDYPLEHVVNPVTLGSRWLALTETKLNARYSSRGGVCLTQLHSVTTTVIKNVRKGLSAISDTISGLTGMVQSNPDPSDSPPQQTAEHLTANVVTVLDTSYDHPEELRLHEAGRKVGGVVAHFQGTAEHGSHIAALTFDPRSTSLTLH